MKLSINVQCKFNEKVIFYGSTSGVISEKARGQFPVLNVRRFFLGKPWNQNLYGKSLKVFFLGISLRIA